MLHRGENHASSFHELRLLALVASKSPLLLSSRTVAGTHNNLKYHVSLAATASKVFRAYVQQHDAWTHAAARGCQPSSKTVPRYGYTWWRGGVWTEIEDEGAELSSLLHSMMHAVCGIQTYLHTGTGTSATSSSIGGSTGVKCANSDSSTHNEPDNTARSCHEKASTTSRDAIQHRSHLQQLQVVLLLSLVQMWMWVQGSEVMRKKLQRHRPGWFDTLMQHGQHVDDPDLTTVISLLGPGQSPSPSSRQAVCMAFERYSLSHLQGRLLPGCCHPGCTNLSGGSEVAIKTLLCSGCRRSRYCSLGCQKVAWLAGGHSSVCGKQ